MINIWLVVWNMNFIFPNSWDDLCHAQTGVLIGCLAARLDDLLCLPIGKNIVGMMIQSDFHIFQRG